MTADAVPQMKICDERNFQMCILFRWNLISCRVNMDCMHHSVDAHSRHKKDRAKADRFQSHRRIQPSFRQYRMRKNEAQQHQNRGEAKKIQIHAEPAVADDL